MKNKFTSNSRKARGFVFYIAVRSITQYLLIGVLLFEFRVAFSQGDISILPMLPPSPEASSLAEYVEVPVNKYSGTTNISIPIADLNHFSINVPINMTYHSGGNRVEEIGSSVGLGWTLNAGGAVTRIMAGLPDDISGSGYIDYTESIENAYGPGFFESGPVQDRVAEYEQVSNGCRDLSPDIFHFNFNGITGKMIFEWNGSLQVVSDYDIKVNYLRDITGIYSWTFILPNGHKYYFQDVEKTRVASGGWNPHCPVASELLYPGYNSAWYLTKITDAYDDHEVLFEYEEYPIETYFRMASVLTKINHTYNQEGCEQIPFFSKTFTRPRVAYDQLRIKRIISESFTVDFNASTSRNSLAGVFGLELLKAIDEIVVKNLAGVEVNRISMLYDHSTGRLTLKQLLNQNKEKPYLFSYNSVLLPTPESSAQDHWGYFNNKTSNVDLIPTFHGGIPPGYNGADRSPSEVHMKAGILESMTHPTGAITEFTYEPNDYIYDASGLINELDGQGNPIKSKMGGGLRIYSIKEIDEGSLQKERYYKYTDSNGYSTGVIFQEPIYGASEVHWVLKVISLDIIEVPCYLEKINARSVVPLFTDGISVGYHTVTETRDDNGNEGSFIESYLTQLDNPDGQPTLRPYVPIASNSHMRSLPILKEVWSGDDKRISQTNIDYEFDKIWSEGRFIRFFGGYEDDISKYENVTYTVSAGISRKASKVIKLYDQFNQNNYKETEVNYNYNSHRMLSSEENIGSDNIKYRTTYRYIFDIITPDVYSSILTLGGSPEVVALMYLYNMRKWDKPIEVIKTKDDKVISAKYTEYLRQPTAANRPYPYRIFELETNTQLQEVPQASVSSSTFTVAYPYPNPNNSFSVEILKDNHFNPNHFELLSYNSDGNILEYTGLDGIKKAFSWGYKGQHLVFEGINADYTTLNQSIISNLTYPLTLDNLQIIDPQGSAKTYWNSFNSSVRGDLPQAQIRSFSYKPMIGVSTITDYDNIVTDFVYDSYDRLFQVIDHQGHVLKEYNYNYKQ